MHSYSTLLLTCCLLLLTGCEADSGQVKPDTSASTTSMNPEGQAPDLAGYELSALPGTDWQLAEKRNEEGEVVSSGYVSNGRKQGSWTSWEGPRSPSVVEGYKNGELEGARVEFDPVGRLRKIAHYRRGQLDGRYAEYRAAIPQITANYKNGELDGIFRAHTLTNGKVNRSISYKNGVQDGPMRWYNDDEELIQERMYKNGELVE